MEIPLANFREKLRSYGWQVPRDFLPLIELVLFDDSREGENRDMTNKVSSRLTWEAIL